MEQYTPAFPIEVVCSPKAIQCFLAFGFHEVEWYDSRRAVRLHKPKTPSWVPVSESRPPPGHGWWDCLARPAWILGEAFSSCPPPASTPGECFFRLTSWLSTTACGSWGSGSG